MQSDVRTRVDPELLRNARKFTINGPIMAVFDT